MPTLESNSSKRSCEHAGDCQAKQTAEDVLGQARTPAGATFERARAKSAQPLKQAQARSDQLVEKAGDKLEKE